MPASRSNRYIIVPGSPSTWTPRTPPITLSPDKGLFAADPLRTICPLYPLEPLFRAIDTTCPHVRLSDYDLITDRRNLRLLLAFVSGSTQEMRIDAEVAGSTVLFTVWSASKYRRSAGTPESGYGYTFEDALTTVPPSLKGSVQHHRVVSYTLGGINLLVRYEVDGCITSSPPATEGVVLGRKGFNIAPTGLKIITSGTLAPPDSIIEIKTGRSGKLITNSKNVAQTWFSSTPILMCGYHDGQGTFTNIKQHHLKEDGYFRRWEGENRGQLQKLVRLIEMIIERLTSSPEKKQAILVKKRIAELQFYSLTDQYPLKMPPDIQEKWATS